MKRSAAVMTLLTLALLCGTALGQQVPPAGEEPVPVLDPDTPVPGDPTGDPTDPTDPAADGLDGEEPAPQSPGDEPAGEDEELLPGAGPEEESAGAALVGDWLIDFPEDATPWQSDGTTFTSQTCTWSSVVPILTDVSLIAGPIECSDGILPTFGLGIVSGGEMSAVAIRFLCFFPLVSCFEGEQVTQGPPDEDPEGPSQGPQDPEGPPDEEQTPQQPDADEEPDAMNPDEGPLGPPIDRTFDRSQS